MSAEVGAALVGAGAALAGVLLTSLLEMGRRRHEEFHRFTEARRSTYAEFFALSNEIVELLLQKQLGVDDAGEHHLEIHSRLRRMNALKSDFALLAPEPLRRSAGALVEALLARWSATDDNAETTRRQVVTTQVDFVNLARESLRVTPWWTTRYKAGRGHPLDR